MTIMKALAITLMLLLTTATTHAQFETATVLGTVRDTSGAVVPEATITLTNLSTGVSVTRNTNGVGTVRFL
jgi:hypothetical protein